MLFSGHTLDEKALSGPWPRVAASPERVVRWRDLGMLGMSPSKRHDPARMDAASRKSTEIGLRAELHSEGRRSPVGSEWSMPRNYGTSLASSVTSFSSPRHLEMTDSTVEVMVKTIETQEDEIQRCRSRIMQLLRDSREAEKKEHELREFVERCSVATQELWTKNSSIQARNNALKAKLDTLLELASISSHI